MGTQTSILRHAFLPGQKLIIQDYVDLADVTSDYNTFYALPNDIVVHFTNPEQDLTLAQWQAMGKDLHSQLIDPSSYVPIIPRDEPPPIAEPCCDQFMIYDSLPTVPIFVQHFPSQFGPAGWSDEMDYPSLGMKLRVFCGPCNRRGLLATQPAVYP